MQPFTFKIQLKDNVHPARRVPAPLGEKVKELEYIIMPGVDQQTG